MARVLNSFFARVFCREGYQLVPEVDPMECRKELDGVNITVKKIMERIKSLQPNSAA
jgi:hypothetical protein